MKIQGYRKDMAAKDFNSDRYVCFDRSKKILQGAELCPIGNGESGEPISYVVWGDSHGEAMRAAFHAQSNQFGYYGVYAGGSGCPPLIGVAPVRIPNCESTNDAIMEFIKANPSIETVFIVARWLVYVEGTQGLDEEPSLFLESETMASNFNNNQNLEILQHPLERTIDELSRANKKIVIVGPVPEMNILVPRSLYRSKGQVSEKLKVEMQVERFNDRNGRVFEMLANCEGCEKVSYIFPHEFLCDENNCYPEIGGIIMYHDSNHLSNSGARYIAPIFEQSFRANSASNK